jgi:hypothetical protein
MNKNSSAILCKFSVICDEYTQLNYIGDFICPKKPATINTMWIIEVCKIKKKVVLIISVLLAGLMLTPPVTAQTSENLEWGVEVA